MLPESLRGPGKTIHSESPDDFLAKNVVAYPNLDADFILQICFEHPRKFDEQFPAFNVNQHSAVRCTRTARWVYENVRYDFGDLVDFWAAQFDSLLESGKPGDGVFAHMIEKRRWPFPPVIIEAKFARQLGASERVGNSVYLIEGTHRVSYLRRMLEREMITPEILVELIQVMPNP